MIALFPWIIVVAATAFEIPIVACILAGFYLFGGFGAFLGACFIMGAILCYFSSRTITEVKICLVALMVDSLINVIVIQEILPTPSQFNPLVLGMLVFAPLCALLLWIVGDCLSAPQEPQSTTRRK